MNPVVLLLAAGRGTRLGSDRPKALVEVAGTPLFDLALRSVARWHLPVVAVAPPTHVEDLLTIGARSAVAIDVVPGGSTRQESVRRALDAVSATHDVVVCHDVARPFASTSLFARVVGALAGADGAIPGVPLSDTVKRVEGGLVAETVPRDDLVAVQTPQAFRRAALERAHREAEAAGVTATDDAALLERLGMRVVVVPGEPENLKVTVPDDIRLATSIAARLKDG